MEGREESTICVELDVRRGGMRLGGSENVKARRLCDPHYTVARVPWWACVGCHTMCSTRRKAAAHNVVIRDSEVTLVRRTVRWLASASLPTCPLTTLTPPALSALTLSSALCGRLAAACTIRITDGHKPVSSSDHCIQM